MSIKCYQSVLSKARVCDLAAALIETFEAFERPTLIATPANMASEGAKEKGQERENADAKRKNDRLYAVRAELDFLLIKISNLTPECAVFNEDGVWGGRGFFSLFSRSYKARYICTPRGGG